jgi:hypothetical protein
MRRRTTVKGSNRCFIPPPLVRCSLRIRSAATIADRRTPEGKRPEIMAAHHCTLWRRDEVCRIAQTRGPPGRARGLDRGCSRMCRKTESATASCCPETPKGVLPPRKGRILRPRRFPEHCRTSPGNLPDPEQQPSAFSVRGTLDRRLGIPLLCDGRGCDSTLSAEENHHDDRLLGCVP